jgi:enoyl-[acyl-carrier protein] reductase I
MYNLLRKKEDHLVLWMRIQSLGKQRNVFTKTVFFLTDSASIRMGSIAELAQKTGSTIIPADATSVTDIERI